ncbi:TPA: type II secretion system protein M [Pseudomonas aeruginosa]
MKMNKRLAGLLNTPAQRWSPLLLRLQAYWRQLAPRERKILAGGGLALCLALTWQVFIDPPLARIEHWQAELPRLRAQAAAVDGVLREVEALRGPTLSGTADAEAIRRSLRDQGLDGFQLDAPQPGQWQLDFASVSGKTLLLHGPVEGDALLSAIDLLAAGSTTVAEPAHSPDMPAGVAGDMPR